MEALFSSLVLVAVWIGLVIGAVVSVVGLCLLLDERKRNPQIMGAGAGASSGPGRIMHSGVPTPAVAHAATAATSSGGAGHDHGHGHDHSHAHGDHPTVPYFLIFGTLGVMTILTIAVSFVNLGKAGNVMLAMAVAAFKASLVMLFFMHLKYERRTLVLIALAPFALAAILFFALFPDVVFGQFHTHDYGTETAHVEKKEGGH